jgi:uroporphyrinogen-III synthase
MAIRNHPVVITRPLAQAGPFAERVAALGREPVIFPLLEISPLADDSNLLQVLRELDSYAMVAFVSPNAIDAAFAHIDAWPSQVTLAVMGEGSRKALARYAAAAQATVVSPRDPLRTDSQTLLASLDVNHLRGKRVLVVRGESGRELLADTLRGAGAEVIQVAAYRRSMPVLDQPARTRLHQLLASRNDWVVTSSEALRNLAQMAGDCGITDLVAKMQQQTLVVPHVRIEETARMLGFPHVTLTGSGDEQLLAALQF